MPETRWTTELYSISFQILVTHCLLIVLMLSQELYVSIIMVMKQLPSSFITAPGLTMNRQIVRNKIEHVGTNTSRDYNSVLHQFSSNSFHWWYEIFPSHVYPNMCMICMKGASRRSGYRAGHLCNVPYKSPF